MTSTALIGPALICHVAQYQTGALLLILGAYREGELMHCTAIISRRFDVALLPAW